MTIDLTKPLFTRNGYSVELLTTLPTGALVVRTEKNKVYLLDPGGYRNGQLWISNEEQSPMAVARSRRFLREPFKVGERVLVLSFSRMKPRLIPAVIAEVERSKGNVVLEKQGKRSKVAFARVFRSHEEVREHARAILAAAGEEMLDA